MCRPVKSGGTVREQANAIKQMSGGADLDYPISVPAVFFKCWNVFCGIKNTDGSITQTAISTYLNLRNQTLTPFELDLLTELNLTYARCTNV